MNRRNSGILLAVLGAAYSFACLAVSIAACEQSDQHALDHGLAGRRGDLGASFHNGSIDQIKTVAHPGETNGFK